MVKLEAIQPSIVTIAAPARDSITLKRLQGP